MKEHFLNDSGYYPYGDYDYVEVGKEYVEQENYDKSFFEVLSYLKDDKEKVKEFLNDIIFVEQIENNNLIHKDNFFLAKELFEKEYNEKFDNIEQGVGFDGYKFNTLTLNEKEFDNLYENIANGDFSSLEIYKREIDYKKNYSNDYNENSIFQIKDSVILNEEELENTFRLKDATEALFEGINLLKKEKNIEVEFNLRNADDGSNFYLVSKIDDGYKEKTEFEINSNDLGLYFDKSFKFLALNDINIASDLQVSGFSTYEEDKEKYNTLEKINLAGFYDIENYKVSRIDYVNLDNMEVKSLTISSSNSNEEINLTIIDKENNQNNITLEQGFDSEIREKTYNIVGSLIGSENFSKIYTEIKEDLKEREKEKSKDKEIEY